VAVLAGAVSVTACSGVVSVPDPAPTGQSERVCTALMADLPPTVLDEKRRKAEPGRHSAAWGDPAITLRCGVDKPPKLTAASACYEVNGVGWFAEEASGGYLFTTIGRTTYVEVGVPSDYAPEANALVDLARTVTAHDPLLKACV
jgi:Protein of unknown function (DUF3515)